MPNPYATLTIPVSADMRQFTTQARTEATRAGNDIGKNLSKSAAIGGALRGIGKAAATGLGVAAGAAVAFGVSSFKAAARVGEMDASLRALAKANGLNYGAMQKAVSQTRAYGIEAGVAQNLVAQFAKNQLDLGKSTQLARVAQDAAVISGKNSSEVLDALIHGVTTQNSLVLRNAGLNVQAGQAVSQYAKQLGKSTSELSAQERAQAVLNEVLKSGGSIAGAYAQAMKEPGKVLRSFPRIFDDIKVSVGQGLVKAFGPVILQTYDLAKALSEAIKPGGKLEPIFAAIGVAATRVARPLIRVVDVTTAFIKNVKPGQLSAIADGIKRFGPAGAAAGAGLAAFAGANIAAKLPVIGPMLGQIVGPAKQLAGVFLGLPLPVKLVVGAFALMLAVSPELRGALLDIGKALVAAMAPALVAVAASTKQLVPPTVLLAKVLGGALAVALTALVPLITVAGKVLTVLAPVLPHLAVGYLAAKAGAAAYAVAQWAVNAAMTANPIGLVVLALAALGAALYIAWTKSATFRKIVTASFGAVQKAAAAVFGWIKRYWPLLAVMLGGPFGIATVAIVKNWGTIRTAASSAWSFLRGIFGHIGKGFAGVGVAAGAAAKVIGAAWVKIKDAVAAPSRWVAFSIMNPLIKGANLLLGKIGMKIGEIPKFAAGGRVPGGWGGGDRMLAAVEPGEWVLTKRQARAIGYENLRGLPHFLTGGPVQNWGPTDWLGSAGRVAGGAFAKVGKLGKGAVDVFSGALEWAAAEAFKAATKPIRKLIEPAAKAAVPPHLWKAGVGKLGLKALDGLVGFIEGKSVGEGDPSGLVALARRYNGHPYIWGGASRPQGGFDCSSFINYLGGSMGLPLPDGFRAPSAAHGPTTHGYLAFGGMKTVPFGSMAAGDVAVNQQHIILVTGKGTGFAARSTATGTGPQAVTSGYTIRRWPGLMMSGGKGGGGPGAPFGNIGSASLQKVAAWVLGKFGIGHLLNLYMGRLRQESGFNQRAVNRWDINWQNGYPSVGYAQVIRPTFQAHAGPYRNRGPFMYGVSIDPLANLWASVSYSVSRYGKGGLYRAWSGTQGYANGGILREPVLGLGLHTGTRYSFGENAPGIPEAFAPMGPGAAGLGSGGRVVINVYPQRGQSETEIAAAVSRRLGWVAATGRG